MEQRTRILPIDDDEIEIMVANSSSPTLDRTERIEGTAPTTDDVGRAQTDRTKTGHLAVDPTEMLERTIDELRHENEVVLDRLQLVGSAAKVGIWEYDFRTDELWVSDELAAIYGLDATALTWPEFASRVHPDDVVSELRRPTPSYPFGEANEFLIRVRHRDGEYRTIRSRSVTVGDHTGPVKKLGTHIDVPEDALLRANDELAEANERLRQFAYLASHDLRSPVRGISQLVSFLVEDHGDALPAGAIEMLAKIKGRADRMAQLVGDLLHFATSDLADIGAELCDLKRLIDDVVEMVETHGKQIVIDGTESLRCSLAVSPFTVCLRNLIDNACKHHDRPSGTVRVSATQQDGLLVVTVTDDGPGISEAEQRKIFEPFYTTTPGQGSGIGLANVLRTATNHGATIDCSSTGAGSTFTLRWPIDEDGDGRAPSGLEPAAWSV